jgi:phage terminase large subunit-like protein
MAKSMMEKLALLSEEEKQAVLAGFNADQLLWDWSVWGRPEQQPPEGEWSIWLYMAGRGAGKTRTAAEWVRQEARDSSKGQKRFALVARTAADVRDVIVEGESGIINVTPPSVHCMNHQRED